MSVSYILYLIYSSEKEVIIIDITPEMITANITYWIVRFIAVKLKGKTS